MAELSDNQGDSRSGEQDAKFFGELLKVNCDSNFVLLRALAEAAG
jgi:hypothetical protein